MKKIENKNKRTTKQKSAILEYLRSVKTHPSAEAIYLNLKKEFPRLSLGTVYRNLEEFYKAGLVKKGIVNEVKYFDGDTSCHSHFFCTKCDKIEDWFDVLPKDIGKKFKKNYFIDDIDLKIKGRCMNCKK